MPREASFLYADIGSPIATPEGWKVRIDAGEFLLATRTVEYTASVNSEKTRNSE
jgi:hypothetical protein